MKCTRNYGASYWIHKFSNFRAQLRLLQSWTWPQPPCLGNRCECQWCLQHSAFIFSGHSEFSIEIRVCVCVCVCEREMGFLVAQMVKNLPAMWETWVWSLGWENPLEKRMSIHSSILAWDIPWTEEPGGLQSMGLQRVGHNWVTNRYIWNMDMNILWTVALYI